MDKAEMIKRYGLTSVSAESTDEAVLAAIDAKLKAAGDAAKAVKTKAIEAAVDAAIAAGKLTKEQRQDYVARGEKLGIDDLNAILNDMHKPDTILSHITSGVKGGGNKEREGWTWDDWQQKASAELEEMPVKDPETFKALYKAKYGTEPNL
jgi:hypothetical protein